jgi:hypothetical protein
MEERTLQEVFGEEFLQNFVHRDMTATYRMKLELCASSKSEPGEKSKKEEEEQKELIKETHFSSIFCLYLKKFF